jgi:hypothetical protein
MKNHQGQANERAAGKGGVTILRGAERACAALPERGCYAS